MKLRDKNNIRHNLLINIAIILSFILLSIFSIFYIWYGNQLHLMGDADFHMARLYELISSKTLFPEYALNSFSSIGNAVMVMYPYVFLYLTAILFWVIGSVKHAVFIAFIIWTFVTLLISYYSSLGISKNKEVSYLFAVIYALSGEFSSMYFNSIDLGVYFSSIFLPLVIFGFVYFVRKRKWLMLSIGMSFQLLSSIISFAFISFFLLIWLLFNFKKINKFSILNLCKSVALTVITTAFVWLPLIKVMLLNKLSTPTNPVIASIKLQNFIINPLANDYSPGLPGTQMLTLYALLGIVLGIIFYRKMSKILQHMYLFGILVIFFTTNLFPWYIFQKITALRTIQFTVRFLVIPQVIFEFILAVCIIKHLKLCKKVTRIASLTILMILILLIQLSSQDLYVNSNQGNLDNFYQQEQGIINVGYKDYWPNVSIPKQDNLFGHKGYSKDNNNIQFTPHKNGNSEFNATNVNNGKVALPFIYYHGTKYKCYLDHRLVNVHPNKNQLMVINHVPNGQHHLHVEIPTGYWTLFSRAISILSIFAYLMIIFVRLKDRFVKRFGLKKKIEASK